MKKWAVSLVIFLGMWGVATPLMADLREMDNDQMKSVTAQDGISIQLDQVTFYDEYGRIQLFDSDNAGSLVLEDVVVDNGSGWGYSFTTLEPLTIDLVEYDAPFLNAYTGSLTYGEENVALVIDAPAWEQNLYFTANKLLFCDQELGSLQVGSVNLKSFNFMLTTPDYEWSAAAAYNSDESGLYYRYLSQSTIDKLQFTYNTASNGSLTFSGIRFANSFTNDIAAYPTVVTTDSDAQGYFIIGKDETPNNQDDFAHINLIEDEGSVILEMTMPMEGSIRMNSVQLGATDLGPVAIDGLQVHNMSIQFIP